MMTDWCWNVDSMLMIKMMMMIVMMMMMVVMMVILMMIVKALFILRPVLSSVCLHTYQFQETTSG